MKFKRPSRYKMQKTYFILFRLKNPLVLILSHSSYCNRTKMRLSLLLQILAKKILFSHNYVLTDLT